jgi:hypothetical protein
MSLNFTVDFIGTSKEEDWDFTLLSYNARRLGVPFT